MGKPLTFEMLNSQWPRASHSLVVGVASSAAAVFAKFGLTDATEQADLLAQVSEETGAGTDLSENLNYTAARMRQVWPSVFPTLASALPFAMNPKALANKVYGGRYGNRPGTDDGWTFRGRGGMQTTFEANYASAAKETGLDCVNNPDLLLLPENFLSSACAFWKTANLNPISEAGNFRLETIRLNGGLINYLTREQWRVVWRQQLGA